MTNYKHNDYDKKDIFIIKINMLVILMLSLTYYYDLVF